MLNKFVLLAAAAICTFTACNQKIKLDCSETHWWGYSYTNGPDLWGQCEKNCDGKSQSPIDIVEADVETDGSLAALQTSYSPTPIDLEHNGHAIELTYEAGSTLTLDGNAYELKQAHLHGGSEHTIDGEHYPLEMHLVHKKSDNEVAVIGIFIEEGAVNPFFAQFFGNLPKIEGEHFIDTTTQVNISDLLPAATNYYTYSGSLTTPKCDEIVTWFVMKEPVQASFDQIETLKAILHISYRPTQKLHGRTVKAF